MDNHMPPDEYNTIEQLRGTLTVDELKVIQRHRNEQFAKDPRADPVYNAAELLQKELPPVRWAVPDILPEGLTLLGGKPKMGKSWMALGLAIATAMGGMALGCKRVEAGDVFYLALEDNQRRMQSRLRTLLQLGPSELLPDLRRLQITHTCPPIGKGAEENIRSWLNEHPSARLVIVDVLAKIRSKRNGRGNGYDEDYGDVEPLQRIASEYGVALLVLVHLRKAASNDALDTVNATLGLSGAADNVLVLLRERGKADAVLVGAGREIIDLNLALQFDQQTALWRILGDAEEYLLTAERQEIIAAIRAFERPVEPKDLYPVFPTVKEGTIRARLSRMALAGDLTVGASGKYVVNTGKHPDAKGQQE